jgi:hypothetical protein
MSTIILRNLMGSKHSAAITPFSASPFMHIFAATIAGAATKTLVVHACNSVNQAFYSKTFGTVSARVILAVL